jgi:hypothetical protein
LAGIDADWGAVGPEGACWFGFEERGELWAVEGGGVAVECGVFGRADAPRPMGDEVLLGLAALAGRVAPVVFDDELFV